MSDAKNSFGLSRARFWMRESFYNQLFLLLFFPESLIFSFDWRFAGLVSIQIWYLAPIKFNKNLRYHKEQNNKDDHIRY